MGGELSLTKVIRNLFNQTKKTDKLNKDLHKYIFIIETYLKKIKVQILLDTDIFMKFDLGRMSHAWNLLGYSWGGQSNYQFNNRGLIIVTHLQIRRSTMTVIWQKHLFYSWLQTNRCDLFIILYFLWLDRKSWLMTFFKLNEKY